MIEMSLGRYPYPPETYSNVFAQLTAIVHGDPPELEDDKYSEEARDFVARCLRKDPERRATYRELLVSRRSLSSYLVRVTSYDITDVSVNLLADWLLVQEHPYLVRDRTESKVDMVAWVRMALEHRASLTAAAVRAQVPQSV